MSGGRRTMMRTAVVGLGLVGLALTVPTFAAVTGAAVTGAEKPPAADRQPAAAPAGQAKKCCLVQLDGPARTVTAGGAPARFELVVSHSARGCTQTRRTIAVRLEGLAPEHVRLERVVAGQALALHGTPAAASTVEVVDPLVDSKLICGADTEVAASYRIAFLDGAPPGQAELVVSAHAVNGRLLDSARATTVVVGPVSTTAPPPQSTPPAPPATEAPAETAAPPVQEEPEPPSAAQPPAAARPPLDPSAEANPLSTTLLTSSIVFALSAMLLLGVLWRLRRPRPEASPRHAASTGHEPQTATLPPGVGAELAMLTEDPMRPGS
ncbi:hypothetical protein RB614_02870 [Phytohabitans sp. ZYX-F-186]|uniref:Uncharacterized protein n=1 Tax=Phytohabitans maris TaxID=3071409 RepID=A0ABU0ZAP7_9ACTN|nr:hypothetical protein [Phytohabitans sp. ZYX-F-186]MDQ7903456.1 hypothetical protein [Phytohabitans sp. ZYX-F-186]